MDMAVKIVLWTLGVAALAALGFYLWLVYAHTPPQPGPDRSEQSVVREGRLGEVAYSITRYVRAPGEEPTYTVASGTGDDYAALIALLWVSGRPVPVEVRRNGTRELEVVFDGPLANGRTSVSIAVNDRFVVDTTPIMKNGVLAAGQ